MAMFYIILFSTYPLSLVARLNNDKYPNRFKRPEILLSLIVAVSIALVAGLRSGIGDTPAYVHFYKMVSMEPDIYTAMENGKDSYEQGFTALFWIFNIISTDPQFMIFVLGVFTNFLNIWTMRRYSKAFELEVFMYIASGYYAITMNGIRQCLVAAILFWATKYIIEGKFIKYFIVVMIMYTMHVTALIMIPVYFIVRCEAWSKTTMKIIVIAAIGLIFFQPLLNNFLDNAEGTKYEAYENTFENEGGANPIRTVVVTIPTALAYMYRDKIKKYWPESNIFVNMSLICSIISVFSMINWIFNRFNLYFQIYTFILLPYIVKNCFDKKEKNLVYAGFLAFYFIFFYYEYVISLGINYTSNFINF